MDEKFEKAIETLVQMIRPTVKADDALKLTQASLNLAHAKQLLESTKKRGAGA
jgi:hypothetical protein